MMIGMSRVSGLARNSRQTSMPEMPGSIQSSRMRSGRSSATRRGTSSPLAQWRDPEALRLEIIGEEDLDRLLVFDDEDGCGHESVQSNSIDREAGRVLLRTLFADRLAMDEIVDILGDVGGVIADALEFLAPKRRCVHSPIMRGSSII